MGSKQLTDGYHLSISLGKALWDDLVGAALPAKVVDGQFDLGRQVYHGVKQLGVKERVVALLEDRQPPDMVVRAKDRAADLWRGRRESIYELIDQMVHVEGDWKIEIDKEGTEFHYATQKVGVDAHVKLVAEGTATLLRENIEIPFTLEKRLGATCHLSEIRYDQNRLAVVGEVSEPAVDLGENVVLRLLSRVGALLLEQQTPRFNPVPILKKEQVESLVAPAGGPLKIQMGVEDVQIEVTEADLTLKVRFGFKQKQITAEDD